MGHEESEEEISHEGITPVVKEGSGFGENALGKAAALVKVRVDSVSEVDKIFVMVQCAMTDVPKVIGGEIVPGGDDEFCGMLIEGGCMEEEVSESV